MDAAMLQEKFARMGARLRIGPQIRWIVNSTVTLDVRSDAKGECFAVGAGPDVEMDVIDVRPRERHLLLRTREGDERSLYLCGHDERHWFVAAIPESVAGVSNVATAMEALKPPEVLAAQAQQGVKGKDRRRRRNAAYRRQGEWFFLPAPGLKVDRKLVLRNEPLSRGTGSKPHWAEFCYRVGGETVHVCGRYPAGVRPETFRHLLAENPEAKNWGWRVMRRNAVAYVKGHIRHNDHATIRLDVWHRVVMNTEGQARAMRHVVFLD